MRQLVKLAYYMNMEECVNVEAEIDGKPQYYDIKAYIKNGEYPSGAMNNERKFTRCMSCQCINAKANHLMEEMHEGLHGSHASGPTLALKIMRVGYYWITMESDCIKHVRTCYHSQVYQNRMNVPPQCLHSLAAQWLFSAQGMDVIGPVISKASNGHEYILVAIDYFTKLVEAASYKSVT